MGNRAVITTRERKVGLYLHWNGGRDTVEPLLRYCELQGYRPPSDDDYGWARLAQVVGNFFGGALSVGVGAYTTDVRMDPGDNGVYVIDGWRIAERLRAERREDGPPRASQRGGRSSAATASTRCCAPSTRRCPSGCGSASSWTRSRSRSASCGSATRSSAGGSPAGGSRPEVGVR